jgi:hypothetical protein
MRRPILLVVALVGLLGLTLVGTATAAPSTAPSRTYVVSRTVGPYNGAAKLGDPGSVPDGEAVTVSCNPGDSIVSGSARINRKTSHGTSRIVLSLDVLGAFWDQTDEVLRWGAFVNATGRPGWNSVTLTVNCRRH